LTDEKINNYINLAGGFLQQNKVAESEQILTKIKDAALQKPYSRFHNCAGMLYLKKNRVAEAKKEFQKEIDLNLKQDEAYFQLGLIYYNEQKGDSAIYAWEKTVLLNPNNIDAFGNLGVCYLNFKKDMNKAEEYWNKALQLNPNYVQGYINLMLLCQNKRDEDCKLKYLRIVLQKGVSVDEIRKRGIVVSDELMKKVSS
jgi:tetratricopeptide (TPR) repeat protein